MLVHASDCNNLKIVKYLIEEKDTDINIKVDNYNYIALMYAVSNGNFETTEYLIEQGADTQIKNIYNETVYDIAMRKGNQDIINLLP